MLIKKDLRVMTSVGTARTKLASVSQKIPIGNAVLGNDGKYQVMTVKLHSASHVASVLGVELDTLYRYARSGRLRGIKMGKLWRFTDADLEEFIRGRRYLSRENGLHPTLLQDHLRQVAHGLDRRRGLVCGATRLCYAEIDHLSDRLAHALLEKGLAPGDRVVTVLPNSLEFVIACFGVWKARGVLVPEYVAVPSTTLERIVGEVRPSVLILDRSVAERLEESRSAFRGVRTVFVKDRTFSLSGVDGVEVESLDAALYSDVPVTTHLPRDGTPQDIVSITYTSGSTGIPKGIMHTHESWLAGAMFTRDYVGLSENDKIVIPLPLHHGLAFRQILAYLLADATIVIAADIYQALKLLREERPTALLLVPAASNIAIDHFPSILQQADDHLRYVEIGAAAMAPERLARLRELLPTTTVHFAYGLTEARVGYLGPNKQGLFNRIDAVAPGLEVQVVDQHDNPVPRGGRGEILLKGRGLAKGYWGDAEPEMEARRGQGFHTGDVGRLDESGAVELLGRLDDVLKVGGRKVNPLEVELALDRHPKVAESVVVGRTEGNGIFECELHAFVVGIRGAVLNEPDLRAHCRRYLEPYKIPRRFHFRSSLPKSPVGKISRHALRADGAALPKIT